MRRELAALATVFLLSVAACSQPGPGRMMGDGYGPGYGRGYEQHHGMAYGMGPGMMGGGYGEGYGMGPGMGPGMMGGGYGPGYGPGRGMAGPGMMGGWGRLPADLTAEQRTRITQIRDEYRRKQSGVMQSMHSLMRPDQAPPSGSAFDEQAARKNYDAAAALHKQMFENSLEARKQIDAVLTPQQREQISRSRPAR